MTAPHDVPTMAELVEAVREWIEHDVLTATDGRLKFHALVAAGMLATIERELALGPQQAIDHAARLGCTDDAELAARIRAGELDDRYPELLAVLRASVADKLAVANPRYR